jgi:hypothetical protein
MGGLNFIWISRSDCPPPPRARKFSQGIWGVGDISVGRLFVEQGVLER